MRPVPNPELPHTEMRLAETVNSFIGISAGREAPATGVVKKWHAEIYRDHKVLEKTWRQFESSGCCTLFQTYDYVASWYDVALACGAADPLVVVVSNESGEIAWIFPLCIGSHKNLRVISFADLGLADYCAPLIAREAPSDRESVMAMLDTVFSALPPCDLISLQKLPRDVEGAANPFLFLLGLERFPVDCHGIRIRETWSELAVKIMQPTLRRTIRRERKKLEERGVVAIETHDTPETLEAPLETLLAMRQERFKAIGLPEMPVLWQNFYRTLATRKDRQVYASITTMTINGQPAATCFGLARGKAFHVLLTTFKTGPWESHRPGLQLFDIMLTNFARQTGNDGYFDFTTGDEVYKTRLGADSRPLYEWMGVRSLKGLPCYVTWRIKSYCRHYPQLFAKMQRVVHSLRTIRKKYVD